MLVLGPNSTCDVCLECYSTGANVPHAITCGHVFCQKCLDSLMQHKCPLCRERFSPRDVRKLHVDRDPSAKALPEPTSASTSAEPVVVAPTVDDQAQRLLDDIARIVKEGGTVNEIRRVIDECKTYYRSQPGNQYTPVRVSCLLLHNLLDGKRNQHQLKEQLHEANAARDDIRDRLTSELEAIRLKYDDLERTSRDEKDTALAIEKSLREHYDQMNLFWKGQMESVNQECRSLREQLDRLRTSGAMVPPPPPRTIELQYFYRNGPKRSPPAVEDPPLSQEETTRGRVVDEDDFDFHLSPLKEVSNPLVSTAPSLMALADEYDLEEMAKLKRIKSPIQEEPEPESELEGSAYPFPAHLQPQTSKVEPIPIPSRTPPSRQSSSMAMSISADPWMSGSKPRDDVVMGSRAPSPSRRGSRREMTDLKRRESSDKDQLVSKLHDLLDSPRPASSLHGHMSHHAELPEPRPASRPLPRPSSTTQHAGTSTHHSEEAGADRRPLVRASDAAMQLEKERLEKMEKERRRLREAASLSNSLKDATNAPRVSRNRSIGSGRTKAVYHAPAETCV